jgi:Legume lectin domain/Bacterial Ig domain/Immunoglobulin domain
MKLNQTAQKRGIIFAQAVTLVLACGSAFAGSFNYSDFSSTNDLDIIHDSSLVGNTLRLTPAAPYKAGAVWYGSKQHCVNGFSTTFTFQITSPGSNPGYEQGGDGISFSIQNAGTDADSWEYGPLSNSLGVSLNTFYNPGEVSGNFVGICTNNSNWLFQRDLNGTNGVNLSDGQIHTVKVDYDGNAINVQIDSLPAITSFPVTLGGAVDTNGDCWVGLGARCGAQAWENQDILSWSFTTLSNAPVNHPPIANGASVAVAQNTSTNILLSASDPDGNSLTYTVGTPTHGVLTGVAPLLTYTPFSNYFGNDSFTFQVNDGQVDSAPATVNINVFHLNHAPVANITAPSVVVASNNVSAEVAFDGSLSSDADNDQLQYLWKEGGAVFGTNVTASRTLSVGTHTITLVVSDGFATGSATVTVEVDPATPSVGCVTYPGFANTNGLSIIHNGGVIGSTLRLTPALANQAGAAWFAAKQDCGSGFNTSFHFQISNPGSSFGYESGGDGISFSIQNSGTDVDSWEYSPFTNSVGVSFNTFYNPGQEVSGNFVGICRNNSHWLLQQDLNGTSINLSDGQVHLAEIYCNGTSLSVNIDGVSVISNFPISLDGALDAQGKAWVGFGARCGAVAWENHDILDWTFCPANPSAPLITSQPQNRKVVTGGSATFTVGATGQQPLQYQWQFNDAIIADATNSSLTISNAQPENAGNYSVVVSNPIGTATSSNAVLTVLTASDSECVAYADFGATNSLSLNKNASVVGTTLRLTEASENQTGTAWHASKVQVYRGFSTTFQFQITNLGGLSYLEPGGDGISFSIQSEGLAADAYEYCPSNNGLGISFNTFWNPGLEVSGNFVGICSNGPIWLLQHDLTGTPINLSDGNVHTAQITYDGAGLSVSIDDVAAIENFPVSLDHVLDADGAAWVGFGARTGGAWERHDILNWSFCTLTNGPVNHAPVARITVPPYSYAPSVTNILAIAPNGVGLDVVLDGSLSSDSDKDALNFQWSEGTNVFASSEITTNTLALGVHNISLAVSDGQVTNKTGVVIRVISPNDAVTNLAQQVQGLSLTNVSLQPLIASLEAAEDAFVRGNMGAGINALKAFQNKVGDIIGHDNPVLANQLILSAQNIINAVGGVTAVSITLPPPLPESRMVKNSLNSHVQLKFAGYPGKVYTVQASSNLVDWTSIGSAVADANGSFSFTDTSANGVASRYYRIVAQ